MKPVTRLTALLVLCMGAQMVAAPLARGEEAGFGANASSGAISVLATMVMAPLKFVACVATVAIGGTAYGLTMGTSETIREELVAGTNQTCGGPYYVTPTQVRQLARESEL